MIEKDFDFEANLAMFDKDREMREIEAELSNKPDIVRLVHSNVRQPEPKYRNDENVLGRSSSLTLTMTVDFSLRERVARVQADCDWGGGGRRQTLRDGLRPHCAEHQPPAEGETAEQCQEPRHWDGEAGGDDGPRRHRAGDPSAGRTTQTEPLQHAPGPNCRLPLRHQSGRHLRPRLCPSPRQSRSQDPGPAARGREVPASAGGRAKTVQTDRWEGGLQGPGPAEWSRGHDRDGHGGPRDVEPGAVPALAQGGHLLGGGQQSSSPGYRPSPAPPASRHQDESHLGPPPLLLPSVR